MKSFKKRQNGHQRVPRCSWRLSLGTVFLLFLHLFRRKIQSMWKIIFLSSRIFTCFSISSSSFLSFLSQAFEASCLEGREVPEKRKKEQFKKIVSGIVGVRLLTVLSRLFVFFCRHLFRAMLWNRCTWIYYPKAFTEMVPHQRVSSPNSMSKYVN